MYHANRTQSATQQMITLAIDEHHGRTFAKVELEWGSSHLAGVGVAYRHPADRLAREARNELATARALSDLADQVAALARATN